MGWVVCVFWMVFEIEMNILVALHGSYDRMSNVFYVLGWISLEYSMTSLLSV